MSPERILRIPMALMNRPVGREPTSSPYIEVRRSGIHGTGVYAAREVPKGRKVLEYALGSDRVKAGIARSKFQKFPDFGTKIRGYIMLTYHNDECWFRSLKIRELGRREK